MDMDIFSTPPPSSGLRKALETGQYAFDGGCDDGVAGQTSSTRYMYCTRDMYAGSDHGIGSDCTDCGHREATSTSPPPSPTESRLASSAKLHIKDYRSAKPGESAASNFRSFTQGSRLNVHFTRTALTPSSLRCSHA
eukprot:6148647-Prymnesium_polylepis.1